MHEPYVPFEITAICHCATCKAIGQMTWRRADHHFLTGDLILTVPENWLYAVRSNSYLCPACALDADKAECESKNWSDEAEAETIIQNIFNNHSLSGF